jgi:hypothetical protein
MGVVILTIEEDVKQRFRKKLYELDCDKGAMGEAISEALDKWIIDNESAKKGMGENCRGKARTQWRRV